jgi:hypothetical protein
MDLELIKKYLQVYLDNVVIPETNQEFSSEGDNEPIDMKVFQVLKGSYQPPIYHVFIDVTPHSTLKSTLRRSEKNIEDFIKMLSIPNRTKVHWNKRPSIKEDNTM